MKNKLILILMFFSLICAAEVFASGQQPGKEGERVGEKIET